MLRETNTAGLLGSEAGSKKRWSLWGRRKYGPSLVCCGELELGHCGASWPWKGSWKSPDLLIWEDTMFIMLPLTQAQRSGQPRSQATLSQTTTWQQEMNSWQIKWKKEKNINSGFKISMFRISKGTEKWITTKRMRNYEAKTDINEIM